MNNVASISKQINQANFSNSELSAVISNIREMMKSNVKLELFEGLSLIHI